MRTDDLVYSGPSGDPSNDSTRSVTVQTLAIGTAQFVFHDGVALARVAARQPALRVVARVDTSARSGAPGGHLDAHVGTAKQSRMVDRPGTAWLSGHPARTSLVERHCCCRGDPPYFKSSSDAFPHRQ
jgi:hypothetical protein